MQTSTTTTVAESFVICFSMEVTSLSGTGSGPGSAPSGCARAPCGLPAGPAAAYGVTNAAITGKASLLSDQGGFWLGCGSGRGRRQRSRMQEGVLQGGVE